MDMGDRRFGNVGRDIASGDGPLGPVEILETREMLVVRLLYPDADADRSVRVVAERMTLARHRRCGEPLRQEATLGVPRARRSLLAAVSDRDIRVLERGDELGDPCVVDRIHVGTGDDCQIGGHRRKPDVQCAAKREVLWSDLDDGHRESCGDSQRGVGRARVDDHDLVGAPSIDGSPQSAVVRCVPLR